MPRVLTDDNFCSIVNAATWPFLFYCTGLCQGHCRLAVLNEYNLMRTQTTFASSGVKETLLTAISTCFRSKVERGRSIYAGIQKFVAFIMSVHIAEVGNTQDISRWLVLRPCPGLNVFESCYHQGVRNKWCRSCKFSFVSWWAFQPLGKIELSIVCWRQAALYQPEFAWTSGW